MTGKTVFFAGAILLLGAAGCVSSSKYQKKEKELSDANEKVKESEAKLQDLQQELAQTQQERDALKVKTTSLAEEKGAAESKNKEYEALSKSLQSQIQSGQLELSELRDKMTVKLKDQILFSSGSAKLSRQGRTTLDAVAGALKDLSDKNIVVAGYTDNVRVAKSLPFRDNWELSSARAIAVVRYLAAAGVPSKNLAAAGFSEFRPLAPNSSPANRSKNRRIEIGLTPADYTPPTVEVN